ncbi:MAG: adenosylcobinamide-phosphate synthase CbiB, partial [Candidatus Limnocylindria bacterium]
GRLVERRCPGAARLLTTVWLLKSSFALRGLLEAADRVVRAVDRDDLSAARAALPWLVSRPVDDLDRAHICSATIESLAENLADSYLGPLAAYSLGGLPMALAYRVVNTADAMLGYHGQLEHLGKASAWLDDVANLVPSRLTAALVVVAAPVVGLPASSAARIALRDARLTASPNAGWPMAAAAGALGVWLEKLGTYRLGDGGTPDVRHVVAARRLVLAAAGLATAVFFARDATR